MQSKDGNSSSDNSNPNAFIMSPLKKCFDSTKLGLATGYNARKDRKEVHLCLFITLVYTVGAAIDFPFGTGGAL